MTPNMGYAILLSILSFACVCVMADVSIYCGTNGSNWTSEASGEKNWKDGKIPKKSDDVVFDSFGNLDIKDDRFEVFIDDSSVEVASVSMSNFKKFAAIAFGRISTKTPNLVFKVSGDFHRYLSECDGVCEFGVFQMGANSASAAPSIFIGKDLCVGTPDDSYSATGSLSFGIYGVSQNGYCGPKSVKIGGNASVYGAGVLYFATNSASKSEPAVEISGTLNLVNYDDLYPKVLLKCGAKGSEYSVIRVGGLTGNGLVLNSSAAHSALTVFNIDVPRASVCEFSGSIQEELRDSGSRMAILKTGDGTQRLRKPMGGGRIGGGVEVRGGILTMCSSHSVGDLHLSGGEICPCAWSVDEPSTLVVNNFEFKAGTFLCVVSHGGKSSALDIRGDIKSCDNLNIRFVLKAYVMGERYKIVSWKKRPDLNPSKIRANDLGSVKPVFEVSDDGLFVYFAKK